MKDYDKLLDYLKNDAERLEIPESIAPEQMLKNLKQHEAQKAAEKKKRNLRFYKGTLAAAACLCLVAGVTLAAKQPWKVKNDVEQEHAVQEQLSEDAVITEVADVGMGFPEITYEDIYASMQTAWEKEEQWRGYEGGVLMEDAVEAEPMEEGSVEQFSSMVTAEKSMNGAADLNTEAGTTNVQTAGVDEGDIVKNDGRYLYQKIQVEDAGKYQTVIQVIDTKDGLKEVSKIGDFDAIEEFYVWEDVLVAIENKYMDYPVSGELMLGAYKDVAYLVNYFHEISFYDISDRTKPEEIKTFTLQGSYASSRIADGYFYGFSKYYANQGDGAEDYDAYIPVLDGNRLEAEDIYLPEENENTSYLVLVAINLENPTEFTDTTGIVAGSDLYYVSEKNIYVADTKSVSLEEERNYDSTTLLQFSYEKGKFALRATGEIKGSLNNSFSLDEYDDHLRVVSTVREYEIIEITDDRTGEILGSYIENERQTNALYVLDDTLNVVGQVEGLAENEQIYSARFMGTTGYFVTFRQTDPLFAVDLSDPANPKILSELKVSGFSEYLHGYGEGRLFGLGMEADEETGAQEGMKLSMFDISDPTNVQEVSRLHLEEYYYSEALYNHHAVMISPGKNIIGFEAEGSDRGDYWREYLIYAYEGDAFVQKLKIDTKNEGGGYYQARGTFIGDTFYLLCGDGKVKSYDLNTGEHLESLEP